ncbi:cytochrome P450 4C1-like [Vanessa cardui]|uniref:cytochrome P450 4C1-like n=1 Tax=Vanessa cardui TaxID=171605 RepID=UPI001F142F3A|nr:cytochrome P450 4C1-like [Vanessa cardui]
MINFVGCLIPSNVMKVIFIALFVIVVVLYLYCRFSRRGRLFAKIPGPPRWPLIGNVHNFNLPRDKLFDYLRTLNKTYGDVIASGTLDVTAIHIYNPNDIEVNVFCTVVTKCTKKYKPYTFLRRWLGDGLLISNGSKWQERRKLLTHAFHFDVLRKYARTFADEAEVFMAAVEKEAVKEQADVNRLINKTTLRIICSMLIFVFHTSLETVMGTSMKEDIDSLTTKYLEAIHRIAAALLPRMLNFLLYLDLTFQMSKHGWEERAAIKELHQITKSIIKERKTYVNSDVYKQNETVKLNKKGRLAMLDLLIENEREGKIDVDGIREEVDTFMFRGFDTTSVTMAYLIMLIANNLDIQIKLYEEMKSIFGDSSRPATIGDLKEMKYLDCCIKETLRLYPAVPYIVRSITEEIVLGGYVIPADTMCQIHIYDLHRRADLYPDAERFIPERFLPENSIDRHLFAYLPFSAGSRNCIGQKFAMLQMKTLMSSLIRKYRLEAVTKSADLKFYVDFVLRADRPIYVRFCPRKL